jgi:hypothetical protein
MFLRLVLLSVIFLSIVDVTTAYVSEVSSLKYAALAVFALTSIRYTKNLKINHPAAAGILLFCLMTALFTFVNLGSTADIFVVLGYFSCAAIYFLAVSVPEKLAILTRQSLIFSGAIFLTVNAFYVMTPSAYTFPKNQFLGVMANPNGLAGLTGLFFLVFLLESFEDKRFIKKLLFASFSIASVIVLLLVGSRSALLASLIAVIFISFKRQLFTSMHAIGLSAATLTALYVANQNDFFFLNRDLYESTGRELIFARYIEKFSDTYFIFGTGVSQHMGRVKSELSYLDAALFSGIGFLGFLVFLFSALRAAILVTDPRMGWAAALVLYISIISVFEGYASNVGSVLSVLFYLLPGLLYSANRKQLASRSIGPPSDHLLRSSRS